MSSDDHLSPGTGGNSRSVSNNDERTPLLRGDASNASLLADSEQQPGSDENDERTVIAEEVKGLKLWVILGTSWIGVFLGAIDSSIIATLSAPISSEFRSLSLLPWLATAYLIANAACQPISGRLTDIFGRGPGLVFSNIFFAVGNLICGLAQTSEVMILGRVVAGIGGGGLMTITTFLCTDLVPLRNRGIIQGVGNICYGAGAMLGGVFGGLVNDNSSWGWRLAFLVQVPPVLVSAVLVAYLVHIPPKTSEKSRLRRIDFTGVLSLVTFLVFLLLGLNTGGNIVPWTHPLPLTILPLSLVALIFFVVWESRVAQPVIPTFGVSASNAGLVLLFAPLGVCICSVGSGYIMKKTGRYVGLGILAVSLQLAASIILTTLHQGSPIWPLRVVFFLLGSGQGAMLTVCLLACLAAVDHSHQATITSATYAFRSVGSTVGITVGSAIYQNVLKNNLWDRFGDLPGAAEEIKRIRDDIDELNHLPEGWYDGVAASFQEAFRSVWFTLVALAALAVISVSLMRQHKLYSTLSRNEED
ncbi:hypothetical protein FHL15_002988 [Xylaria flabelliformis]|uniref:Major facilitator superfamily (MFS) profile domain-containing protein n=1 Tax=Xylaria flabelliformis TaxID=2512241 RepID=A0A553I7W0_9PEZI|nr:hypothetical protein FHL15_002988 [Xylaria flabelliformis]